MPATRGRLFFIGAWIELAENIRVLEDAYDAGANAYLPRCCQCRLLHPPFWWIWPGQSTGLFFCAPGSTRSKVEGSTATGGRSRRVASQGKFVQNVST